ncbi:hypothetical protein RMCBS344292_18787 [Rhizopus microsporus]|nr:hypothetical protein RMCBS344292_18787 [Rhizopus microsporus]
MNFLKKSNIPQNILNQFWEAADNDKKGFLTDTEFCIILKLIACAQHGVMTGDPILATSGNFNGDDNSSRQPPRHTTTDVITPEERTKYISLFQSLGPVDGILNGEVAKNVFIRSGLPPAKLQAIWDLANTRKSGTLNQTEFIIAMHYIERTMKESAPLPPTLPAGIYASAIGRAISSPLVRQNTLQVNKAPIQSPVFKGSTLGNVEIAPEEYARYKTFFDQLSNGTGFVSGPDAVVFFRHSKLPESDLARIWDVADTNSTGQLTEQEFAMAMHMINRRIAGGEIPSSLPTLRTGHVEHQQPQQTGKQPAVDLLGISSDFDETFSPATFQPTSKPQPQHHQQITELSRTQSILQSNLSIHDDRSSVSASSPKSTHSMPATSTQKSFDPFAGFKASQSTSQSTTGTPVTLNKLKEESELKRSTSSTVDISEIESKFPDLSTMEQSFAAVSPQAPTNPATASQSIPPPAPKEEETIATTKNESALEDKPKKESKYNFDLSAFEPPSTTSNSNLFGGMSVKDELSSIFGSPTTSSSTPAPTASTSTALDDIFGSAPSTTAKDNNKQPAQSSFEDIFFNNK